MISSSCCLRLGILLKVNMRLPGTCSWSRAGGIVWIRNSQQALTCVVPCLSDEAFSPHQ